jgi:hypothetical protein
VHIYHTWILWVVQEIRQIVNLCFSRSKKGASGYGLTEIGSRETRGFKASSDFSGVFGQFETRRIASLCQPNNHDMMLKSEFSNGWVS